MKTIETLATVTRDGQLAARVPADILPGEHRVILVIEEEPLPQRRPPGPFPVIHVDAWPEDLSLRREDLYGDDGR